MRMDSYLEWAIGDAPKNILVKEVQIEGFTSNLVKGLLNNLLQYEDASYLEIGVWQGSTFVSALYKNNPKLAVAIDNFSEFGGSEEIFLKNCSQYLTCDYKLLNHDALSIDKSIISTPINIYFYDGYHSEESQYRAIEYYYDVLADKFILLIDDWNWEQVKRGTNKVIQNLNLNVEYVVELPARWNGDEDQWWNGVYAAVLKK